MKKDFDFSELSAETAGRVWDFFNQLSHTIKTRIIVLGLIDLMVSNFSKNNVAFKLFQKIFENELSSSLKAQKKGVGN